MGKKRTTKPAKNMVDTLRAAFPEDEIRVVDPATAAANLRRGNEAYARARLPHELAQHAERAEDVYLQAQSWPLPKHLQHDIRACARSWLWYVRAVGDHVERGEIGQATLAAIQIGVHCERITRFVFQADVERENKRKTASAAAAESQQNDAQARRDMARQLFGEYAPDDRKSLGTKNLYREIGQVMAQRLGLAKPLSERAIRGYLSKKCGKG